MATTLSSQTKRPPTTLLARAPRRWWSWMLVFLAACHLRRKLLARFSAPRPATTLATRTLRPSCWDVWPCPTAWMGASLIQDVAPPRVLRHLDGNNASMFQVFEEFMELEDHGPPIRPYMDEVLKHSPTKHLSFVQLLKERGLVSFTRDHGESVSCFFVKKKMTCYVS